MAQRFSGQNFKFFKFLLSLNSQETWIERKQHQRYKFDLKATEPCWNIDILNVAYSYSITKLRSPTEKATTKLANASLRNIIWNKTKESITSDCANFEGYYNSAAN